MRKLSLALLIVAMLVCMLAISTSAAATNEFGEIEYVEGKSEKRLRH